MFPRKSLFLNSHDGALGNLRVLVFQFTRGVVTSPQAWGKLLHRYEGETAEASPFPPSYLFALEGRGSKPLTTANGVSAPRG